MTVTDNGTPNLFDSETITVTVAEINTSPVLGAVGNKTVDELALLTFTATASDTDLPADTLTFTLTGAPAGAAITTGGVFTWTPTEAQGGSAYTFTVTVTDNGTPNLFDSETITVTVAEINVAPTLAPVGDRTVDEGVLLTFTASATDPDRTVDEGVLLTFTASATDPDLPANTLTFILVGSVAGASIDFSTGVFTWTPTEAQGPGVYIFDVVVADDGSPNLSDSVSFTVTVAEVNLAPTLAPVGDRIVDEGARVSLTATATDVDLPINTLTWSLDSGPGSVDTAGNYTWVTSETTPPGTYTVVLRVTDSGTPNLSDTVSFDITVNEVNAAPTLDPVGAKTVDEQTLFTFAVTASDTDIPADTLSFTLTGAPAGAAITTGGVFTWTPTEAQGPGVYTFTVTVTDNGTPNLTDSETITITVDVVNDAPAGGVDSVVLSSYLPTVLSVLANDTDADMDGLSIDSIFGDTTGGVIVNTDGTITYYPKSGWIGTDTFSYLVSDGNGGTAIVVVTVEMPPRVLAAAEVLSQTLGTQSLAFAAPGSNASGSDLTTFEFGVGVALLSEAFFQSLGALRLPLAFLGISVLGVLVLGGFAELPLLVASRRRRYQSVVMLEREDQLMVRAEPTKSADVLYSYEPTAAGFLSLDKARRVDDARWILIESPVGKGWVESQFVSETVDLQYFLADKRPSRMVRQLADALHNGRDFTNLLAPRGLAIALTNRPHFLSSDELRSMLDEIRLQPARSSQFSPEARQFRDEVIEPLRAALQAAPEINSAASHSRASLIPVELWNFQYLVVNAPNQDQWLVYFEYIKHRPHIVGFGIDA